MKIAVKSGDKNLLPEWQSEFNKYLPDLKVYWWDDPELPKEEIDFAFVWEPPAGFLASLTNLKLIFSSGAGVDHIVSDDSWPQHVPLIRMFTQEAAQRMSEQVLMCSLMAIRLMPQAIEQQRNKIWDTYDIPNTALENTVGIMGLGNLGSACALSLQKAGFNVIGWARSQKNLAQIKSYAGDNELAEFLAQCQILTCLLPETPSTQHIINKTLLQQLPVGASIINVGRGSHLHVEDLKKALNSGQIRYAFLDVFKEEPLPPDSWLWTHPQVIITPHIAADASRQARIEYVSQKIIRFLAREPLKNVYNLKEGY